MNKAIISGRLTAAPKVRYTQDGKAIASFGVAVDYSKDETSFLNCTAFDRNAEFAEKYLNKGSRVEICGRIKTGSYTQDGRKVYYTEITVSELAFGESKAEAESRQQTAPEQQAADSNDGFMNIPNGLDEEMPFA